MDISSIPHARLFPKDVPADQIVELAKTHSGFLALLRGGVAEQVQLTEQGQYELLIAPAKHLYTRPQAGHFHVTPELFIQLAGTAEMQLIGKRMLCKAGQILLIPRGVLHVEHVRFRDGPFCNLVFAYNKRSFVPHIAIGRSRSGRIQCRQSYPIEDSQSLFGYLNDICQAHHDGLPAKHPLIRGLLLAHLARVQRAVETISANPETVTATKVVRARQLIIENLCDPDLSVAWLARRLHCSADYLSHLFCSEVGHTIIQHIHLDRIALAKHLLGGERNISEIALTCGFGDAGYFSRIFKRNEGISPRAYRQARSN